MPNIFKLPCLTAISRLCYVCSGRLSCCLMARLLVVGRPARLRNDPWHAFWLENYVMHVMRILQRLYVTITTISARKHKRNYIAGGNPRSTERGQHLSTKPLWQTEARCVSWSVLGCLLNLYFISLWHGIHMTSYLHDMLPTCNLTSMHATSCFQWEVLRQQFTPGAPICLWLCFKELPRVS